MLLIQYLQFNFGVFWHFCIHPNKTTSVSKNWNVFSIDVVASGIKVWYVKRFRIEYWK